MMKVFKITILCCIIVCLIIVGKTFVFADNDGACAQTLSTEDNTVRIVNDFLDLVSLATDVNNGKFDGYYGITFKLACDLDVEADCQSFDSGSGWIPIGTTLYPFKGTFDGNGYSIRGIYIDKADSENVGLFGVTNINATVKNLTVQGSIRGGNYTGGIVGYSQALIENCVSLVSVTSQDDSLHVGGITGYNSGKITQSQYNGEIRVGFSTFVGGIAGSNLGTIEKCFNVGEIASYNSVVGGIAGNNAESIEICMNSGRVTGKSSVGGIVGNNQGSVKNAFSKCSVYSVNGSAGGLAGSNEITGSIAYSMAVCNVEGLDDVASVCGYNMGVVANVFYDECISSRIAVNGIIAENSKGLPTRIIVHEDALEVENKLFALVAGNETNWIKRKSVDGCYFYPELKYFYENEYQTSTQICKGACLVLQDEDISLEDTKFLYNGEKHEIDVKIGDLYLELGQDYYVNYTDNRNSGKQSANIEFAGMYSGRVVKDFNIIKSLLEVEWKNLNFIYDGEIHRPELKIVGGLVENEEVVFEYSTTMAKNVGEYEISAKLDTSVAVNNNYDIPIISCKYTILQASLTLGWSNEKFIYNGQIQIPSASVLEGNIGNEQITINYEYFENIKAGEQSIRAYLADTETNANYMLNAETYTYFIEKKLLNVIWENTPLYYNGTAQFPKVSEIIGVINDDNIEYVYSEYLNNINADENDGYHVSISLSNTETNNNYELADTIRNYSIHKITLIIEWWDTPLYYNGNPQCPNYYIKSGIVGNDEIAIEFLDYSGNINACDGNAYNVEIELVDNLVNSNYILSETVKKYGISKANFVPARDVEFNSKTFGYDGEQKNIFIESVLPNGVFVEYENNGKVDVGQYTVTAKFSVDTKNYNSLVANTLSATMSIAQMIFEDEKSKIMVTNKGEAIYGLSIDLNKLNDTTFKPKGKKLLVAYSSSFSNGIYEYRIPLGDTSIDGNELHVLYKTSLGEIVNSDFELDGEYIVFTVENATVLAIYAEIDLTWLWISMGGLGFVVILIIIVIVICKKKSFRRVQVKKLEADGNSEIEQSNSIVNDPATDATIEGIANTMINENIVDKGKSFYLDGVYCLSYEWFIKSLNVKTIVKQKRICAGDHDAEVLIETLSHNTVYWLGKRYRIYSKSYEDLIKRAKEASNENN